MAFDSFFALRTPRRTSAQSLQEYGRGLAGGLIFSLPLLFTQEVWQAGFRLYPARLALYIFATWAVLLLYNRYAGLRDDDASWWECALDSVEEMGLGLLLAALILWMSGQLNAPASLLECGGKIVMGGMTVAIGVSVGTAQLGASIDEDESDSGVEEPPSTAQSDTNGDEKSDAKSDGNDSDFFSQTALAWCGAILIAANIAPTEEALLIAQESSPLQLFSMALFSLLIGAYILFFAEFRGASRFAATNNRFELARGIVVTYAVALCASASALFFFGRFDGETWPICLSQTVVVGLAGTLGASAGRLLLQSNGDQ